MSTNGATKERTSSRRGFVRRVTGASAAVFAGFAAAATPAEAVVYRCCNLARGARSCPGCTGGSSYFRCPSGYNVRRWYCCAGGDLVMCGECNQNSSCWGPPPYACSCGTTVDNNSSFCCC